MEQSIIEIKNIGKKYNIAHQRGGYVTLRDVLTNVIKSPFSFLKTKIKQAAGLETKEEFWALKDINFEVKKGEVIGIIGANGAGKSTLLKILSQITPPTTGEIILRGRVGSLLEVGTGFHPELTGRENIFLNGAILGMKKKEIAQKFNQIVEFSGIEKFLDTPVKHYSSGMYVRLAFSVAAHMEPDILIIDEVLAVGDAEFQKKCLGKMNEITKIQGRTILFVSHNMEAIQQLCSKTILLREGKIVFCGSTIEALKIYRDKYNKEIINLNSNIKRRGDGKIKLSSFHIEDIKGNRINNIRNDSKIKFVFSYACNEPKNVHDVDMGFSIEKNAITISTIYSSYTKENIEKINHSGNIIFNIKELKLTPGIYNVRARVLVNGLESDWPKNPVGSFEILPKEEYIKMGYKTEPNSIIDIEGQWTHI